ncbi:unnamed protein product, partial [Didymodactylos carnosus]
MVVVVTLLNLCSGCCVALGHTKLLGFKTEYRDYEHKDHDEIISYKLTPAQISGAMRLRQMTNRFIHNTQDELYRNRSAHNNYKEALNSLSADKSIIICKPDKGKGIVILDKSEYIEKMNAIVNDTATFKQITDDPTMNKEDKLVRFLLKLHERGFISDTEYKLARPVGSRFARLYGLPKVHKPNRSIRPILSSIKTFNYGLGLMLANRLAHLRSSASMVKDSFEFANTVKSFSGSQLNLRMISFDVKNLFTKVPLAYTIDLIIDKLYEKCDLCSISRKKMKCRKCEDTEDFRTLLRLATSETHFVYNNNLYEQIDGVSIGGPLAGTIADIFMIHLEESLHDDLYKNGVRLWRRFVDDTFALVEPNASINSILSVLNGFHPSIEFTFEMEVDNSLSFLDVHVIRSVSQYSTTIYRKSTFTGLIMKWQSYVPLS